MTKEACMLKELDREISRLLAHAAADTGALMRPDLYTDTRYVGFCISKLLTGYVHPQSRYYSEPEVKEAVCRALHYLLEHRRKSGLFDLSSCNFDSAPDTAFTINALMDVSQLLKVSSVPGKETLLSLLLNVAEAACEGILSGGFHTPNHRWAIAAALKTGALLTGRQDFSDRADVYLQEGLDISDEGEFAERSSGTYNAVNDEQMIRLYLATGNDLYLKAARCNLEMMLSYFDPDGSIFTFNSTRQDCGKKIWPGEYYALYLLVGYLMHDASFASLSESMWEMSTDHGVIPQGLPWLMRFPDLEPFGECMPPQPDRLSHTGHVFTSSGIGRWRNGNMSVTALAGKPDFLFVQSGSMSLCASLYGNVCDQRNFIADHIDETEDGCILTCHMDSWYYLPYGSSGPETSDWWKMNNAVTREKQIRGSLDLTIRIHVAEDSVTVALSADGLDRVPLRLELGFTPGSIRGNSFLMSARPGGEMTVTDGAIEVSAPSGDCLTVTPCFASHNVLSRMGGAYPKAEDRFTVYLTCVTPCRRQIEIGTRPFFPVSLS